MTKVYEYMRNQRQYKDTQPLTIFIGFVGLLVAIAFILLERLIIKTQLHKVEVFTRFFINRIWYFLGEGKSGNRRKGTNNRQKK